MYIMSRITEGSGNVWDGADHPGRGLDGLGFATEEEGNRAAGVGEVERLEAAVQY